MSKVTDILTELHNSTPYPNGQQLISIDRLQNALGFNYERFWGLVKAAAPILLEEYKGNWIKCNSLHFIGKDEDKGYTDDMLSATAVKTMLTLADISTPVIMEAQEFYNKLNPDKQAEVSGPIGFVGADGEKFSPNFAINAMLLDGKEWWSALWLYKALGYVNWQNFFMLIRKVKKKYRNEILLLKAAKTIMADKNGNPIYDTEALNSLYADNLNRAPGTGWISNNWKGPIYVEFSRWAHAPTYNEKANVVDMTVTYNPGDRNTVRNKPDFLMDEEFCYIVAMEANASFENVRLAKVFFAKKLKEARLVELEKINHKVN